MIDVDLIERVRRELLADIDLDYVGLGSAAFQIGEALGVENPGELRSLTLRIIEGLLADHLVEAGMAQGADAPATPAPPDWDAFEWLARQHPPTPGEWQFDAWAGFPSEIVERLTDAWSLPSSNTDLDTICWFRATDEGHRKALEWRAERDRLQHR